MQQLLDQLGIDWHLLLSQAVNFFLLLIVLRLFVYKPLLKLMHDRQTRIAQGLTKADEADKRLLESEEIKRTKIKEGEAAAISILKKTETDAKALEAKLLDEAHRKEAEAIENTQAVLRAQEESSRRAMQTEAAELVKRAIVKAVELSPDDIDDALIKKAVEQAQKTA